MSSSSFARRRFLAISAAAAAGATWFQIPQVLRAAGEERDPFGGWPIGIQSYSLRKFDMLEAVRHMQGLGVHYTEFYSKHLPITARGGELQKTLDILKQAGIRLNAHGVSGFTANHEANREVFEFAKRAKIKNITANPEPDSFDSLDKLVAEYQIRICIHNHGPGALYDTIDSVQKAVEGRHKLIGACVDTGHFIRSKEDPTQAVKRLAGRVFALHIKDEEKREKASHNVVIGRGHLDVAGLFRALKETRFPADGSISLEYEANPDNPIDDMRQCLDVARKVIAEIS